MPWPTGQGFLFKGVAILVMYVGKVHYFFEYLFSFQQQKADKLFKYDDNEQTWIYKSYTHIRKNVKTAKNDIFKYGT